MSAYLIYRMLLCACVHGVKSEISQVRNFAWHRDNKQVWSLAPPCSNLSFFRSKCTILKKVLVTLLGLFGAPRSDFAPHSDTATGITPEACAARLCSHTFSVGLILEPREGWIVIDVIPRQKNQPKGALTSKSLVSVACLVFPFSLLWPSLLTCSGHASVTATSPSLRPCPEMYLGSAEP